MAVNNERGKGHYHKNEQPIKYKKSSSKFEPLFIHQ